MKTQTKLKLLGATFLTTLAFGAAPAFAQDDAECPPGSTRDPSGECFDDEVVVTGSRLRRDPANAPAPLIQLTQEDLLQSGEPNLVDYLADVPALSGSTVPEDTTGANLNDGGLSLLNLRDLGAVRTLVLVDGRRHVGAPQGGLQVDVDTIPTLLVDNVEIVTGGQSAVYGADAVSGVVNFILRRDFEGLDIDAASAQINQDGQRSERISAVLGHNFFNDRLNIYGFGEFQRFDQVTDADVDWRREAWVLFQNDTDVNNATPDGQLDNILLSGLRDSSRTRGGVVILANQVLRTPAVPGTDPDIPSTTCSGLGQFNAATHNPVSNNSLCFNYAPENPSTYIFSPAGVPQAFNWGSYQDQDGASRRLHVGGDGLNPGTEFSNTSRIPESEAQRYQIGLNLDITDNIQFFLEGKYAREETYDEGQPTFIDGGILQAQPGIQNRLWALNVMNISTDNAFLDPVMANLILNNTRNTSATSAVQVADRRAIFSIFGPIRSQLNTREVERYVAGFRGDLDQLLFVDNFDWEIGYTYGNTHNENDERGIDSVRFHYSIDAVFDTAGLLGPVNGIVCRNRLLLAQGFAVNDPLTGAPNAANDAIINACVPQSIFGVDLRRDGYNPAAEAYYNATITVQHDNFQHDLLAFGSGELWDFFGAGPIGLSVGYEWRREKTEGIGRSTGTAGRLLFLNTGPDFAGARYNTNEYFAEVNVPLLDNSVYGQFMEISGAYRYSDYSTVGTQEARSFQFQYRPISDILFRMTYGESVRVPNLSENFAPATQTFANNFVDPCDSNVVRNLTDPVIRANRLVNCNILLAGTGLISTDAATSGPTFVAGNPWFDGTAFFVGVAGTGVYQSGRSGVNSGNPFLQPERGRSYTASLVYEPSWFDGLSLVMDYYHITITDAIAAVTAQTAANQCVNGSVLNANACATLFRDPVTGQLPSTGVGFIQGSLNYAKTMASGIDFAASYTLDLADTFLPNWGEVDFRLRGNYLIRQEDFTNINNPGQETAFDTTVGLPRTRFLLTTSWAPTEDLRFVWDWDWQAAQEITDESLLEVDADNRHPLYLETKPFSQHDFSVAYEINDNISIRGGVVNAFDNEPDRWLGSQTTADNFDLFGRRWYIGARFRN